MEFPKLTLKSTLMKRIGFIAIGALGGFAYYYFIGCTGGSCPITGNPWTSTAYGALIGFVGSIDRRRPNSNDSKSV